jgi:hypothetical protein
LGPPKILIQHSQEDISIATDWYMIGEGSIQHKHKSFMVDDYNSVHRSAI